MRLFYLISFALFILVVTLIAMVSMRHARRVMDREDDYTPPEEDP